jgi:K+-transporting ATPase KdpF subunit
VSAGDLAGLVLSVALGAYLLAALLAPERFR